MVQNCWDVGKGRHSISNAKKGMMSNSVGHKRSFDATADTIKHHSTKLSCLWPCASGLVSSLYHPIKSTIWAYLPAQRASHSGSMAAIWALLMSRYRTLASFTCLIYHSWGVERGIFPGETKWKMNDWLFLSLFSSPVTLQNEEGKKGGKNDTGGLRGQNKKQSVFEENTSKPNWLSFREA